MATCKPAHNTPIHMDFLYGSLKDQVHVDRCVVGWSAGRHVDHPFGGQISPWPARKVTETISKSKNIPNDRKNQIRYSGPPRVLSSPSWSCWLAQTSTGVWNISVFFVTWSWKPILFSFTLHAVFLSFCFYFINISTSPLFAKERANPCDSVQFSILANQIISILGLFVVRSSGQCSRGEVGGGSSQQLTYEDVQETEPEGPLQPLFRAADGLPEGILWTAWNCRKNAVLFLRKKCCPQF